MQVLALVNVDFTKAVDQPGDHLTEIVEALRAKDGLEYCPREQTPQGRVFEHASDAVQMIKHLRAVDVSAGDAEPQPAFAPMFYLGLSEEKSKEKTHVAHLNRSYVELAL